MFFNQDDLEKILKKINKNITYFIATNYEKEYLTDQDKNILREFNIDYKDLYSKYSDNIFLNYNVGMLAQILSEVKMKYTDLKEIKERIRLGKVPLLTFRDKETLKSIKMQSLADIRALSGRIFQDVNNIITSNTSDVRADQESFLRRQIYDGAKQRKSIKQISTDISKKTNDWSRDFNRIVEFVIHKAYSEGSVAIMDRLKVEKCYVQVRDGACSKCVNIYLTGGKSSAPKIFELSKLKSNGTNFGKKAKEYIPVIPPSHPYCLCDLRIYRDGYVWNSDRKKYVPEKGSNNSGIKVSVLDQDGREIY